MNLAYKLLENYNKMPNKICLIQDDEKITYKELYNRVSNFKKYLESKGIKKGNKVLVLVPMSIELYVTLLSIWSIGATPCFMDAGFIKTGMKKNEFNDIDAVIGITKYILYSNINKNLSNLKLKINVNVINKLKGNLELKIEDVEDDFSGILTYTSGTTGKPKIAARSHEFLQFQGKILEESINYEEKDIELSSIPIFTLSNINVGITTVIADGNYSNLGNSNAKKLVKQIKDNDINRIMAAPGLLNVITEYCIRNNVKLKNITKIFTGGGAVFLDFVDNLKSVFPNAQIVTLYGSTEAEPIAKLNINDITKKDIENTKNGKGILAGNIIGVEDCKIIKTGIKEIGDITKEEFEKMQTTEIGEIVVTGKNVLKGYVGGIGDKENKFSVEEKKYHRTGDLGLIDENNRLWLRGRIKEPFFNIEAALHSKFKMGKTAIFKEKDKIILVLERDNDISENDIKKAISFENIDEIKYVKKIPVDKRHSTKVDYNELKKILKKQKEREAIVNFIRFKN